MLSLNINYIMLLKYSLSEFRITQCFLFIKFDVLVHNMILKMAFFHFVFIITPIIYQQGKRNTELSRMRKINKGEYLLHSGFSLL